MRQRPIEFGGDARPGPTPEPPQRRALSVTQLTERLRGVLEPEFPDVWVEGEVSNLSAPASGHWYYSLKDETAQVRCAMFRQRNLLVRFPVKDGAHVLARGRVSLYEARGEFQVVIEHLEEAGEGVLRRRFEALKQKLAAEGLFDTRHKQPLPSLPRRIGVITSPTGAAIRDILHILRRRFPAVPVLIYPVAVQGEAAPREIEQAIRLKLIPSLKGVQLMYNHGDDKEIGGKAIGKIEQAYLDDEGYLVVRGVTDDGSAIGAEVFERIRNELLDSTIPMLSIHWTAQTLNQTKVEAEKIANPDAKVVKEISLVKQGYYPEANIIEVQCSADRLRWKTDGGIYTESEASTTAKPTLQHRMAERHDLLFNKFAKLSDEAKADLAAHPEKVADMYADIVPEMWKELSGYKQKEKRERDAYSVNSAKEFEETYEKVKDAFPEDTRESTKAMLLGMAQDSRMRTRSIRLAWCENGWTT